MHNVKIGDIFKAVWGYDQTNVDYYEVVKLVGKTMVEVMPIGAKVEETGNMSGKSWPVPGSTHHFRGAEPLKKKVNTRYGTSIKIDSVSTAYLMQVDPITGEYPGSYVSWYA